MSAHKGFAYGIGGGATGKEQRGERGGLQGWGHDPALAPICSMTLGHLSGPPILQLDMEGFGPGGLKGPPCLNFHEPGSFLAVWE